MVFLLHSAFIRRFLIIDIIQSAEILHDYHNVPLKKCFKYDDSSKKKLFTMFVNIMCKYMQACDHIFRKLSERMAKIYIPKVCSLFCS